MTDNHHPMTPPPELVYRLQDLGNLDAIELAYQAGADQELKACCEWFFKNYAIPCSQLRAIRRPKPPSLKEQALAALARLKSGALCADRVTDESIIRRALELLDD